MKVKKKKSMATFQNAEIISLGQQYVMPEGATHDDAIRWHQRMKTEANSKVAVSMEIDCFPLDGAFALKRAIENIHGFASNPSGYTDFFDNWQGTTMIGMAISATETVQVPWGPVQIPSIEGGELKTAFNPRRGVPNFIVGGVIIKKHQKKVQAIFEETKRLLAAQSTYRGKVLRVDFGWARPNDKGEIAGYAVGKDEPKFWDVSELNPDELIFDQRTQRQINLSIFNRIKHPDAMRKNKVPLKRGVLMAGPFGTGKTLLMAMAAKIATDHGWTFMLLKDAKDLAMTLRFAAVVGGPVVVAGEDIDRVMSGERDDKMDEILNVIDGADTKGVEILTLLTTNQLEKIEKAILRQGRCPVIMVHPPDADAATRLIRLYGRGLLADDFNYDLVGEAMAGQIPATIREAIEQAKVAAIGRIADSGVLDPSNIEGLVTTADAMEAADYVIAQAEFAKTDPPDDRKDMEKAADVLGGHISTSMRLFAEAAANRQRDGNGKYEIAHEDVT